MRPTGDHRRRAAPDDDTATQDTLVRPQAIPFDHGSGRPPAEVAVAIPR
jgi:vacuolar-type H+-ATPase subunit B/Vma2